MSSPSTRRGEAGLTMTEVLVVALIMSIMMVIVTESMTTLSGVRTEQRTHFQLGDTADRMARRIEEDVALSTRVFGSTPDELAYLRALEIGDPLLLAGRRLPRATDTGYFAPDPPQTPETGNILFLSPRGPRVAIKQPAIPDRLVQTMRFVVYAPVQVDDCQDLMRWISEPVISYWDLIDVQDPVERADVLMQLYEAGVRYAWDPQSPRANGLYEITAAGGLQLLSEERRVLGREDPLTSRPLGPRSMQLARSGSVPGVPVPMYATGGAAFDSAFEIKIDGSHGGKLVLLRFVVTSALRLKRMIWSEVRRLRHTSG